MTFASHAKGRDFDHPSDYPFLLLMARSLRSFGAAIACFFGLEMLPQRCLSRMGEILDGR